jgi:hypothetical protein
MRRRELCLSLNLGCHDRRRDPLHPAGDAEQPNVDRLELLGMLADKTIIDFVIGFRPVGIFVTLDCVKSRGSITE